jgi:mono/diheme cytochrome c family protein
LALLVAGGMWWWSRVDAAGPADPTALRPDDAAVVATGQRLYTRHCASCHGADLRGQPDWRQRGPDGLLPAPPHDASGHTWHHPDAVLFAITQRGVAQVAGMPDYRSAMPIYGGQLRDDEIVAVLSFIKSRWPADIRARHDEVNAAAREAAASRR